MCINFKLTSNPLGLALFVGPLNIVERYLLNQIVGLVFSLIHQISPYYSINSGPYRLGYTIVESLNNHPSFKAMVRAQLQKVFELFPSLIKCLIILLGKVGDLAPQTCRFAWWEEFGKKSSGKLIPCGNAPGRQKMHLCSRLIPKWEGKQLQSNGIGGDSIELQCVTHL